MGVSLDGYVAGPDGGFAWAAPGEELHRFHNEQMREISAHFCGRGLYETMVVWETMEITDETPAPMAEFAEIWRALPKIVFSSTLTGVEGNARLATGSVAEEYAQLDGKVAIGGAALAGSCPELIDEYGLFVSPVAVGGGTPFFPVGKRIELRLGETRSFGQTLYLRLTRD